MNFSKYIYWISSFLIFIIFVLPFVYVSKYVILVSDDLCRASVGFSSFFIQISDWYLTHNGRYINSVLSFLPVYRLEIYRTVIITLFIILGFSLFDFISRLLRIYQIRIHISRRIFISSVLFVVIIAELPSLFEFFYWYAASTVYLLSFVMFLYFLLVLLKIFLELKWSLLTGTILIILLNGNNELFLAFNNLVLISLLVWKSLDRSKIDLKLLFLNVISWLTSVIFILSPGTLSRRGELRYEGDLFVSIKVALIYGGRFILENLFDIPNLLFLGAVFLILLNSRLKIKHPKCIHPLVFLLISYISIISFYGLKFYATGLVQRDFGRVGNILHLIALVFFLLNIINLSAFLRQKKNFGFPNPDIVSNLFVMIILVFFIFKNENYVDLRNDLAQNNLIRFENELRERNNTLKSTVGDTLILKQIKGTLLLKPGDAILHAEDWTKKCYLQNVNVKYSKSFRVLEIE